MNKVDYVWCIPGNPSSQGQMVYAEMARTGVQTTMRDKVFGMALASTNNIYTVRNGCLSRQGCKKNQKPFEGIYEDYKATIWYDSDNIITMEGVIRLLSHDVDIVAGWYRYGVYNTSQFSEDNKTACGYWDFDKGCNGGARPIKIGQVAKLPKNEKGLIEVDYTGFGLIVIKKGVFEAIGYPWFRSWVYEWQEEGVKMADVMTDDTGFCWNAKRAGFKIFIDPEVRLSHEKKVCI